MKNSEYFTYIYRSNLCGFSIRKVMHTVEKVIAEKYPIKSFYLPCKGAGLLDVFRNCYYVFKLIKSNSLLYHITGDVHYLTYILPRKKTIITVHDIMYYNYLKGLKKKIWKLLYIQSLKKAGAVIFISSAARKQVEEIIDLPKDKVSIIPNPVSEDFFFSQKTFSAVDPVILHIGTLERKNLLRVIEAIEGIPCHLRIIGELDKMQKEYLEKYKVNYSNGVNLTDQDILLEYLRCDIVSFPSLYEGFGMPIIEGQAVGRPVLTSNWEPMKTVAGENGAYLVDPESVRSIREGFLSIINDVEMRKQLITNGIKNSNKYQAEAVAKEYELVYKKVLIQ